MTKAREPRSSGQRPTTYMISVESTAPIRTVIEHFVEGGVAFVVFDSGNVASIVSEHDVLSAMHDGADIDEIWAADIASVDMVTADGSDSIDDGPTLKTHEPGIEPSQHAMQT